MHGQQNIKITQMFIEAAHSPLSYFVRKQKTTPITSPLLQTRFTLHASALRRPGVNPASISSNAGIFV